MDEKCTVNITEIVLLIIVDRPVLHHFLLVLTAGYEIGNTNVTITLTILPNGNIQISKTAVIFVHTFRMMSDIGSAEILNEN